MKRKFNWHWLICFLFIGISCFLPTDTAEAAVQYEYYYDEKQEVYFISDVKGASKNEAIVLPTSYNGRAVIGIKEKAFEDDKKIKKVTIPYSYTIIESTAFYNCTNLQEVVIKADIKQLEKETFYSCEKLEKIVLPKNLQTIKGYAISNTGIKSITIPKSVKKVENYALNFNKKLYQVVFEGDSLDIEGIAIHQYIEMGESFTPYTYRITVVGEKDSDAEKFAKEQNYLFATSKKLKVELDTKKMFAGEQTAPKVYNNPYKVKWKSSNKSVVNVNKYGYIVAKKAGKATLTATINNKKYSYKMTVVKRTQKNVLDIIWSTYVTEDMTDYEKVEAAFNWIARNVDYDYEGFEKGYTKYGHTEKGAFEYGLAVCDGMTKAFNIIIQHYGIPAKMVTGTANGGAHAWSIVKIGTRWYFVDPTWHILFASDKQLDESHNWSKGSCPKASEKAPDENVTTLQKNGTKISAISKTLYVGKSTTLKLTDTSAKGKWSTSNKKIVSVDSKGKITAKKAGTAKVYCKINGKKYTVKVTVKNPYLNETKINMVKGGDTFKLKLTGATAKKYSSSKSSVVSVSKKGVLTAKKSGTATISVKASNGKTYKCKVTVKSYALSQTKQTIAEGETYQLSVNKADKNTNILWKSSNTKVAYVDANGLVTAKDGGTATISAVIGGASYKCKVTVHKHNSHWIAENATHGAKAKLVCKECGTTVQEGIQLIDSEGNTYYGNWNTTTDVFNSLNKTLEGDKRGNMIADDSYASQLLEVMFSQMAENKNVSESFGCTAFEDECFFILKDEGEDASFYLNEFCRYMYLPYDWEDGKYEHHLGIISFTWDVYGDGEVFKTLYVLKDYYELVE